MPYYVALTYLNNSADNTNHKAMQAEYDKYKQRVISTSTANAGSSVNEFLRDSMVMGTTIAAAAAVTTSVFNAAQQKRVLRLEFEDENAAVFFLRDQTDKLPANCSIPQGLQFQDLEGFEEESLDGDEEDFDDEFDC